jgi:putative endonuclease
MSGLVLAEPEQDSRQRLGRLGEDAAAAELARVGITILERRARTRAGELDLVALDGELVVFVEVKARRGTGFGTPAEAVGAVKRRRLARVALEWLARRRWLSRRCRFDVVEVFADGDTVRLVRHHRDAFRA